MNRCRSDRYATFSGRPRLLATLNTSSPPRPHRARFPAALPLIGVGITSLAQVRRMAQCHSNAKCYDALLPAPALKVIKHCQDAPCAGTATKQLMTDCASAIRSAGSWTPHYRRSSPRSQYHSYARAWAALDGAADLRLALVAQRIEQWTSNPKVAGSNPAGRTFSQVRGLSLLRSKSPKRRVTRTDPEFFAKPPKLVGCSEPTLLSARPSSHSSCASDCELQLTDGRSREERGLRSMATQAKGRRAAARVQVRIDRLTSGNPGDVRPVGSGVSELRINYGPGYRVYYLQEAQRVIVLLCGGNKSTQEDDIQQAQRIAAEWRTKEDKGDE